MNCEDFKEIADSYLSDELAVETNHEIFKHLENCTACRTTLALRRKIRDRIGFSIKNADEFKMNPNLAVRIRENLYEKSSSGKNWRGWKMFAPILAGFLIFASIGLALLYNQNQANKQIQNYLFEFSHKAIGDHQDCATKKLEYWKANAGKVPAEKTAFVESVKTENTEVISAHDCIFDGQLFTHYILRREEKIISVLKITSENRAETNSKIDDPIICNRDEGLQVASFISGKDLVFVISDMTETENLSIARTLSDSIKLQTKIKDGQA